MPGDRAGGCHRRKPPLTPSGAAIPARAPFLIDTAPAATSSGASPIPPVPRADGAVGPSRGEWCSTTAAARERTSPSLALSACARRLIGIASRRRRSSWPGAGCRSRVIPARAARSRCRAEPRLPLEDESWTSLSSLGVIHHTSNTPRAVTEAHPQDAPTRRCTRGVMVYNRTHVWLHLFTAYERMLVEGALPQPRRGRGVRAQYRRPGLPISRCYRTRTSSRCVTRPASKRLRRYLLRQELRSLEESWASASPTSALLPSTATSCAR